MCHDFLLDTSFYHSLSFLDQCIAEQVRQAGCPHCGAVLHVSNYPRKPRGVDRTLLGQSYTYRLSFCCERDGCRKRCTPPSVRFLGRKLYLGVILTVLCAREQGLSACGRRQLMDQLDIWPQTLARWQHWWTRQIPATRWWTALCGRLMPAVDVCMLPGALLGRVEGATLSRRLQQLSMLLMPLSSDSCSRFVPVATDPQRM